MKTTCVATAAVLFLFLSISAFAQNSGVGGSIADTSGALIPGVSVTATNTQTGVAATTVSNETGTYNFPSLQPGIYKITAELPGFRTETYNNYEVGAGDQLRLNFRLQVAAAAGQNVEVTVDAATILATSSASIGTVLSDQKVRDLPLVGEDVLQLISTMAGVTGTQGLSQTFAGVQQASINTVRDGLSVSDGRFNNGIFATTVINPDLVGEMRLILTPVDAELGRGNGQVQISTRSGTNRLTGSIVENIKNSALNSNTWTNNRNIDAITGLWKPTVPNWQNNHQYSISAGGPIRKNKTFFFALWDQQINYQRTLVYGSVMTDPARQGIFRYFDNWNNGNAQQNTTATGANPIIAVVDALGNPKTPATNPNGSPYTGGLKCFSVFGDKKLDGSSFAPSDCPGGTALIGPAWDANRAAIDSTGYIKKVLTAMPHANYYGSAPTGFTSGDGLNRATYQWILHRQGDQGASVTTGGDLATNRKQINIKIDHNFNAKHKVSVGYTRERNLTDSDVPNWPGGISYTTHRWPQVLTANFVSTLSPSLLNEFRYGIRYEDAGIDAPYENQFGDAKTIAAARALMLPGSKGYNALVSPGAGNYAYGGSANGMMNTNPGQYNGNKTPLFSYGDTISWSKGKHAYKFGGEIRFTESKGYNNSPAGGGAEALFPHITGGAGNNNSPLVNALTGLPNLGTTNRTDVANMSYFLAGSVSNARQTYWINSYDDVKNGTWHDTNDQTTGGRKYRPVDEKEYSFFFKDDWKITRALTLNLGVRYEFYGAPYIPTGFTSTAAGQGLGLFGIGGTTGGNIFGNWMAPGSIYLTGYGPNTTVATALTCASGVSQSSLLPTSSCDPSKLTNIEFIGPHTPNSSKTAVRNDRNNFGPAIGFAWQVPWFGADKTTVRGGYQITYGGSGRVVGGGGVDASETVIGGAPGSLSTPQTVLADFNGQYLDLKSVPALVPVIPTSPALPGATVPVYARSASFSAYDPNFVTPYTQNLTLSVTRSVKNYLTVDVRYIGTLSRKQQGNFNLNTTNVYHNKELFDALQTTRAGLDAPLFDQMLAGLNLNNGVNGYGPIGTVVNGVLQTGSAHMRRSATFTSNLANGDYADVASALNGNGTGLPANGTAGGFTNVPAGLAGVGGRLLRNGCDRLASGQSTVQTSAGVLPIRCFPENYITANPQLSAATFITNSASSNYHSLQAQLTIRPTHGVSYQATYTWAKNLGVPATGYTDPLDRGADYSYVNSSRTHDFRSNGTFELPFGPNKFLLGSTHGLLARMIERWQTGIIMSMSSGSRASVSSAVGFSNVGLYANSVPDIVGPFSTKNGQVRWNGPITNGVKIGTYFDNPGPFVTVADPQCSVVNHTDTVGFNLFTNGSCSLSALADSKTNQIVLQNPQPGRRGSLGQNSVVQPGSWNFDMNLSKSFRVRESKSLQVRFDATNVFNHPVPSNPSLVLNSTTTAFGTITGKGNQIRQFQGGLRFTF
jgi:hypothetical protein